MFPEVMVGITDASIDPQPFDAGHPQARIDHGHGVYAQPHIRAHERPRLALIAGGATLRWQEME